MHVNHLGKLRLGARPAELAESSSFRFSLIADWLVTRDDNAASNDITKQAHDISSQKRVSGVGFFAIFSINVIDNPNAPPDSVKIHLSYLPLTSSSASIYDWRVLRYVSCSRASVIEIFSLVLSVCIYYIIERQARSAGSVFSCD